MEIETFVEQRGDTTKQKIFLSTNELKYLLKVLSNSPILKQEDCDVDYNPYESIRMDYNPHHNLPVSILVSSIELSINISIHLYLRKFSVLLYLHAAQQKFQSPPPDNTILVLPV